MKLIYLVLLGLMSLVTWSQDKGDYGTFEDYNKEGSNTLYLLRCSWYYLDTNDVSKVDFLDKSGKVIHTEKFKPKDKERNFYMRRLMDALYYEKKEISGIQIDDTLFHVSNNPYLLNTQPETKSFVIEHSKFCSSNDLTNFSDEQKVDTSIANKFSVNEASMWHECGCPALPTGSVRSDVRLVYHYFYENNDRSYWNHLMDFRYSVYTSAVNGNDYFFYFVKRD